MPCRSSTWSSASTMRSGSLIASGNHARTSVPPPGGLCSSSGPSSAPTRSSRPRSPLPPPASAPPRAVVGDLDAATSSAPRRTVTRACVARACLATFASASATTKYAAVSTAAGSRSGSATSSSTGIGARAASVSSAASSPRCESTAGWMPAASSRSSSTAARASPAHADELARRPGRPASALAPAAGRSARDEPLLRAVMEVAAETAALAVARLDDPRARVAQRLDLRAQLDLEALVLQRQRGAPSRRPAARVLASAAAWTSTPTWRPWWTSSVATASPAGGSENGRPSRRT